MKSRSYLSIFAACLLTFSLNTPAHAVTYTWDANTSTAGAQDGNGTWDLSGTNWMSAGVDNAWVNSPVSDAYIGATATNSVITMGAAITVGNLTLARPDTIQGAAANSLTINGNLIITNGNPTISAKLSGTGFTVMDGASNGLTLTGTNDYTGTLLITNTSGASNYFSLKATEGIGLSTAANLVLNDTQAGTTFGFVLATSGTFSRAIGTGADQVQIFGQHTGFSATGSALVLNFGGAGGNLTWGTASFSPTQFWLSASGLANSGTPLTLVNGIDLNGATRQVINGTQTGNAATILAGPIVDGSNSGAGLTLGLSQGAGIMYLSGTSTYTGTTSITGNSSGRVILGGTLTTTGAVSTGNGGTGSLATSAITIGGPQFGINLSGTTTIGAAISGSTSASAVADTGNTLVLYAPGTIIFTGSNSYSGGTLIKNGVMQIGNGGTTGTLPVNSTVSGSSTATLAFNRSDIVVVSNTINGGLGLSQIGTGTLTLVGSNFNYTGPTTVTSGTLQLGNGTTDGVIASGTIVNNSSVVFNTLSSVGSYSGNISGAGSLTKIGNGTMTLGGSNGYTGVTTINAGTLKLANANAVAGTSNITVNNGGTLSFASGAAQIFTLPGGTTMTLNNGATLTFGIGNATGDKLVLATAATVNGTITISLSALTGANVTNYQIISAPSGGLNGGTFVLATLPPSFSGSISQTDTGVFVSFGGITTVYWKGGTSNSWASFANFTSDQAGATPLAQAVSSAQDVIFSANTPANEGNTILGGTNIAIKSLTVNDTNAVGIGGTNTLTIATTIGNNAIKVSSGAGATTISSNLAFGSGQSGQVEVDSANGLTISGTVSGDQGLTKVGNGLLMLTGTNNYTGGTFINAGTVQVSNANSLGDLTGNVTFSGTGATLQLASLTGTLTSSRNYIFSSGTGTVDTNGGSNVLAFNGTITGSGVFNKAGLGQMIVSTAFSTPTVVSAGTLTLLNPTWLGIGATGSFNIASGATLEVSATAALLNFLATSAVQITGNGTFLKSGAGNFQIHNNLLQFNMTGGVIELAAGLTQNGGINGNGSAVWTNNKASLQIDSGATFDTWDGQDPIVDALLGSGTLTRIGYGTALKTVNIGVNNGSGTFAGTITNDFGTINITKSGTGTQVFSGTNSYAGSTAVTNGVLRVTNANGLGFGAKTYVSQTGQHTATVSGSATLDLAGAGTINKAITLNTGNLINSNTLVDTTLDSGISGIQFTTDPNLAGTYTVSITGGNGSATAVAGVTTNGTPAGNNLYVAMTAAGNDYNPASAPSVTILDGSSNPVGGTVTAVVSTVALTGTANNVGGDGNLTINAVVSGAGGFTKVGNGTLTLGATNTYAGDTGIGKGKVVVAGSISGNVNVGVNTALVVNGSVGGNVAAAAGAVSGIGTIGGNVSLASTGSIQGGTPASTGTLTVGSLDLSAGGTVKFTIDSATTLNSLLVVNNTISLSNNLANLVGVDLYGGVPDAGMQANLLAKGSFTILKLAAPVPDGTFAGYTEGSTITVGFNEFTISYAGGDFGTDVVLTYVQTVPEPQTWAMFLGGTGMLVGFLRSRRFRR